jgi:hypothetical protein
MFVRKGIGLLRVNRRNYYRILHVQPEAPVQIITASYRTMMSKLKAHPDLGGDTSSAASINEAYAVLSDPAKRARYDEERRQTSAARAPSMVRAKTAPRTAPVATAAAPSTATAASSDARLTECPFCRAPAPPSIGPATRCARCASPLAFPPASGSGRKEFVGRRAVPRMSRADSATLFCDWQVAGHLVELRNISLAGVALVTDLPVQRGHVIRVVGTLFDVLAVVVNTRRVGPRSVLHATLRTAHFSRPHGVMVSTKA